MVGSSTEDLLNGQRDSKSRSVSPERGDEVHSGSPVDNIRRNTNRRESTRQPRISTAALLANQINSVHNNSAKDDMCDRFRLVQLNDEDNNNNHRITLPATPPKRNEPYAIIIDSLYVVISQFLYRRKMSTAFLDTFRHYVNLIIEEGMDPLEDPYLLTVQRELTDSYTMTQEMERVINYFLLQPQNLLMKQAIFVTEREATLRRRYFVQWRIMHSTAVYQAKLIKLYENYIKSKFVSLWREKFQRLVTVEYRRARDADEFRLKAFAFDKFLYKFDAVDRMQQLADTRLLNHVFQQITKRQKTLQSKYDEISDSHKRNLVINFFHVWKIRHQEQQWHPISSQRCAMKSWKRKISYIDNLEETSDLQRSRELSQTMIKKWSKAYNHRVEQKSRTDRSDGYILKKKYMNIMVKRFKLHTKEEEFRLMMGYKNTAFYLNKFWVKRFQNQLNYHSFLLIKDDTLKRQVFSIMKKKLFQRLGSDNLETTNILKRYFTEWKLARFRNRFRKHSQEMLVKDMFKNWRHIQQASVREREYETNTVLRNVFIVWRKRYYNNSECISLANGFQRQELMTKMFKQVVTKKNSNQLLERDADSFRKLYLFQSIVEKYKDAKIHRADCNNMGTKKVTNHTLRMYFEMWQLRTEAKQSKQLNENLLIFKSRKSTVLKKKYFRLMKSRYHLYSDELLRKSEALYQRHLGKQLYVSIIRKLELHSSQMEIASQKNSRTELQSRFTIWVERYSKSIELRATLSDIIDQQNIEVLSSYLSMWSMKLLRISRNNQSIDTFRTRWDRATLRGLISLWKERYQETQRNVRIGHNDEASTLVQETPKRPLVPPGDTIRGSVSVRKKNLDAMMNRYRNNRRAIPSPVKSDNDANHVILNRLSPLRRTQLDFKNMAVLRPNSPARQTPARRGAQSRTDSRYPVEDRYLNGSPRGKQV